MLTKTAAIPCQKLAKRCGLRFCPSYRLNILRAVRLTRHPTRLYGYTGEAQENGLVRYYAPETGRFISKDIWQGDYTRPLSINRWNYVESNPINFIDPTGLLKETEENEADLILEELKTDYNVLIKKDYGWSISGGYGTNCGKVWYSGFWETLDELKWTKEAVMDTATAMGGDG